MNFNFFWYKKRDHFLDIHLGFLSTSKFLLGQPIFNTVCNFLLIGKNLPLHSGNLCFQGYTFVYSAITVHGKFLIGNKTIQNYEISVGHLHLPCVLFVNSMNNKPTEPLLWREYKMQGNTERGTKEQGKQPKGKLKS